MTDPTRHIPTNKSLEVDERWQDALRKCQRQLGDNDYAAIKNYSSPEEMLAAIERMRRTAGEGEVSRLLRNIRPKLVQLKTFAIGIALLLGLGSPQIGCLWGLLALMLELAIRSDEMLDDITAMWSDIGLSLDIFEKYRALIESDARLQEAVFEVLVELLLFGVYTIDTLKHTRVGRGTSLMQVASWLALKARFRETSEKIAHRVQIIKQTAEASKLVTGVPQESDLISYLARQTIDDDTETEHSSQDSSPILPCYYLPFAANPHFFGREKTLTELECHLGQANINNGSPRSVALWATGGVGKTQIALEYANRQRNNGVQAIFWIASQDESESAKCFTEIAELLALDGHTTSKGHDQNRLLVLHWLQRANIPWLLIFDNVESQKLLDRMSPTSGNGSILITCRSELRASSYANNTIEVPTFTDEEGGQLLRKELGQQIYTDEDLALSQSFSATLGGHALAIDMMARHMKTKKKPLKQFVTSYQNNPHRLHREPKRGITNKYYDTDLESMWTVAFNQLEPNCARVLGILAMLAPDKVPIKMFSTPTGPTFDEQLDDDEMEEVVIELRDLALARSDEGTDQLSTHRLIQAEYRQHLNTNQRCERFVEAVIMLHELFPQQKKGFALFNHWHLCESLIDHVETLCERYEYLSAAPAYPFVQPFVYLIGDASRYLLEIGRFDVCARILEVGFHYCRGVESLPYTNLCVNMGAVLGEQGRDKAAKNYNKQVLDIREHLLHENHPEVGNALSNYALAITGTGQNLNEAEQLLNRSLDIDTHHNEDGKKVIHLRHYNLCFCYKAMGQLDKAREHVNKATRHVEAEFGKDSRYLNITYRILSDIECTNGNFDEAYKHSLEALKIAKLDALTTPWVSASYYKLGIIRTKQRKLDEAISYLHQALNITRLNERLKGDAGDTARVLHRLAEAYSANCEWEKSADIQNEADKIYDDLISSGEYTKSDNVDLKWEYLVCLKLR